MNNKKKKKSGAGGWAIAAAIILIVRAINNLDTWEIQRFFWRLSRNSTAMIAIAAIVISVVIAVIALAASKKRAEDSPVRRSVPSNGARSAAQHSHDRVQGYTGTESDYEHWKKQLDGFLAAGIIDRKEYIALLERRKTNY